MPATDDFALDPQTHERIRTRALERGTRLRRRATVVRRSVTVAALLALAVGGLAIAETAHGAKAGQRQAHITGSTTSSVPHPTTSSLPPGTFTTVTGSTSTTVPHGSTTTTVPPSTTTSSTVPVSTSTTVPAGHGFSKNLPLVVAPGTLGSTSWTVPSGNTAEITTITLARTTSPVLGTARIQIVQGTGPLTLVALDLHQLSGRSVTFTLSSPVVLHAGAQPVLTVSCDTHQAACDTSMTLAGEEVPVSNLKTRYFFDGLADVVAPGTTGVESWTVPGGDTFSLTDTVIAVIGQGMRGLLQLEVGGVVVYQATLATIGAGPVDDGFGGPVTVTAGKTVSIHVSCGTNQGACGASLLFTGQLTSAG